MGKKTEHWEARTAECEELIRLFGKAFDLIPVNQLRQGHAWFPSPEALEMFVYAKDRLTEYRRTTA